MSTELRGLVPTLEQEQVGGSSRVLKEVFALGVHEFAHLFVKCAVSDAEHVRLIDPLDGRGTAFELSLLTRVKILGEQASKQLAKATVEAIVPVIAAEAFEDFK